MAWGRALWDRVRCSADWMRGRPMSSLRWPRNVLSINNLMLYLRNIRSGEGLKKELQDILVGGLMSTAHDCLHRLKFTVPVSFSSNSICTLLVCSYYTIYFLILHTILPLTYSSFKTKTKYYCLYATLADNSVKRVTLLLFPSCS